MTAFEGTWNGDIFSFEDSEIVVPMTEEVPYWSDLGGVCFLESQRHVLDSRVTSNGTSGGEVEGVLKRREGEVLLVVQGAAGEKRSKSVGQ